MRNPTTPKAQTTWVDVCERFQREHAIEDALRPVLETFNAPWPRGGHDDREEMTFEGGFDALEAHLVTETPLPDVADDLLEEVDADQARMMARRVGAVDTFLGRLHDAAGRILRVGLRHRLNEILNENRPHVMRVRALADFYYSHGGLLRHRGRGVEARSVDALIQEMRWREVSPGVAHGVVQGMGPAGPVYANVLRINPAENTLKVVDCRPSLEAGIEFSRFVAHSGAIAAVSGGFFLYSETDIAPPSTRFDPVGMLLSDGILSHPPVFTRGSLLVDSDGQIHVGRVGLDGLDFTVGNQTLSVPTTFTHRAMARIGPDRHSVAIVGREVVAVGSSLNVPLNGFVMTCDADVEIQTGDRIIWGGVPMPGSSDSVAIQGLSGGPLLLKESVPQIEMEKEGFWGTAPPVTFSQDETGDQNLLPRLAAGLKGDGHLILAAVDGRHLERALGVTLQGMAALMRALGCHVATNLDGGSSKRMVIEGKVVDLASTEVRAHHDTDTQTRPVHTALLIHPITGG